MQIQFPFIHFKNLNPFQTLIQCLSWPKIFHNKKRLFLSTDWWATIFSFLFISNPPFSTPTNTTPTSTPQQQDTLSLFFSKTTGPACRTAAPRIEQALGRNSGVLVIGHGQDQVGGPLVQAVLVNYVLLLELNRCHYSLVNHFCIGELSHITETCLCAR